MTTPSPLPIPEKTRVLLVDDDSGVLCATQRILERAGHEVVACNSGDEALVKLEQQAFDVMVSDIQMPGITGLKLLRAVRERDLDLPVVLVTGNPGVRSAADAVEYGAFRYLIKPVPNTELRAVVLRAVSIGRAARSKREYLEETGSGRFKLGDRAGVDAILDRALSTLWIAYQPIVRAADLTTVAYEALMRVDEPLLPHPGAVLSAAERAGRLHDVGRAVRSSVVASSRATENSWLFFVNLHPEDLLDPALYEQDSPFSALARRVVLEVTERASLDQVSGLHERIAQLRALGFQIALDDLGAGYAGLTSFTQLEPEFVKLDMSLVRGVHQDSTKQKVIRSMVRLCQDMGKKTIAEGIETPEERDALLQLGCDFFQGYLFARPGRPFPVAAVG
jgi:EAL domain-containing protein (putative c-di-GMP-specific phosphodiesterase class I)/CheY-like chemotaxis protein